MLNGLDGNAIGHKIFKNPTQQNMNNLLARVAWLRTKWDKMPTEKYQLFLHNLNTATSVWLLFLKKKIMPMQHDTTIFIHKVMLLYYIMKEILVNVGEIIWGKMCC